MKRGRGRPPKLYQKSLLFCLKCGVHGDEGRWLHNCPPETKAKIVEPKRPGSNHICHKCLEGERKTFATESSNAQLERLVPFTATQQLQSLEISSSKVSFFRTESRKYL